VPLYVFTSGRVFGSMKELQGYQRQGYGEKILYREKRFKKGVPKFFIFACIYGKFQKFLS